MSTHYTPVSPFKRNRALFGAIVLIGLFGFASVAWSNGNTQQATVSVAIGWLCILVLIERKWSHYAAMRFHLGGGVLLAIAGAVWYFIEENGISSSYVMAAFVFGMAIVLVNLSQRIDRLEAPMATNDRALTYPGIYRITCHPNGKHYIGQTSRSIGERWKQHRQDLHIGRHFNHWLQNDWNLYRPEQFSIEVLEVITNPIWLLERERYWQDLDYDPARRYNPPNIPTRSAPKKPIIQARRRRPKSAA